MRDATAARGLKHVCEGRAGGPQGSALTCIVFPILLDGILKETEQRFPGVETKAIQDDVDLYGDPAIILGEGGALDFILAGPRKVGPEPNLKRFQAYKVACRVPSGPLGGAEEVAQADVHHHEPDTPVPSRARGDTGRRGQGCGCRRAPGDQGESQGSGAAPGRGG